MDCLDHPIPAEDLHSIFLHLCISLSLYLLTLLPLGLLLIFVLNWAKRVHLNTRLLLAIIPLALALELVSRMGKVVLFQLLLRHDALAAHSLHQDDQQLLLCLSTANFSPFLDQILHWTITGPSLVAHFLLNSLPLVLLAEKFCATIFYKHYETGQRFLWLGIGILAIQLVSALLVLAHMFRPSIQQPAEGHHPAAASHIWAFAHLLTLLLTLALLFFNKKLSQQLTASTHQNSSTLPCPLAAKGSSPRLVTCRYQIRENRRSLRFCVLLSALMGILAFVNLLIRIFYPDNAKSEQKMGQFGIQRFLMDILKPNMAQQVFFTEMPELAKFLLATCCALFGHQSLRHSLLSQLGVHCKLLAKKRQQPKSKASRSICLAVTNASSASASSSSSTQSNSESAQPHHRRGNFSRISDAHSMNAALSNAHFDALHDYWAKNGPEKGKKKKGNEREGGKKGNQQQQQQKFRSAPCSTVETALG